MKKKIGDRILVLGGMVVDWDEMATITKVCDGYYMVHVDSDPIEDEVSVNEAGDIVFPYPY